MLTKLVQMLTKDGVARQQLKSYNHFITTRIQDILHANQVVDSDIDHQFYLKYTSIRISKPTVLENMIERDLKVEECLLRDLNYFGNIYVDLEYIKDRKVIARKNVLIGKFPVMLGSVLCHGAPDFGGYFIVKGVERVILIQEQLSKNRIIVNKNSVSVTSATDYLKSKTDILVRNGVIVVRANVFSEDVNVVVVLKAMGMESDREIMQTIGTENEIEIGLEQTLETARIDRKEAFKIIGRAAKRESNDAIRTVLSDVILPNIKTDGIDMTRKCITICLMVRFLLLNENVDDIDFLGNKRFELSGSLLCLLFEDAFQRFNSELKKNIDKVLSRNRAQEFDAATFVSLQVNLMTTQFTRAIATGNWVLKRFRMDRSGVTQVLNRLSYISAVGMLTKVQSQFEKTRKLSGPRALQTSFYGMLCPNDTPEGESCGLVKNLSILAEVSLEISTTEIESIINIVESLGLIDIRTVSSSDIYNEYFMLFIDGTIIGLVSDITDKLRKFRRQGLINKYISVYKKFVNGYGSIYISTDAGRLLRPFIINLTEFDMKMIEGNYYLDEDLNGKIEFLDANEQNDVLICSYKDNCDKNNNFIFTNHLDRNKNKGKLTFDERTNEEHFGLSDIININVKNTNEINKMESCGNSFQPLTKTPRLCNNTINYNYTHYEICDYAILGYVAGLVPFINHNQSPRNTYQCAMGKQSFGVPYLTRNRFDTLALFLTYPQLPVTTTKILDLVDFMPSGQNAMVCVMSFSGYDIEDALIINKSSVERGFGICDVYRSTKTILSGDYVLLEEEHRKDDENINPMNSVIVKPPGTILKTGDPFIIKERNEFYRGIDNCTIDKVLISTDNTDNFVKTRFIQHRVPIVGDKFSSRHGQKGVVGRIVNSIDLPFNDKGEIPDIIMNPHGFPSRMTVGKILELISGKDGVLNGKISDSTAFSNINFDSVCLDLQKHGFNYGGKDCFTDGRSGEIFTGYIFYGPVYYQKLKHMVYDKIHARSRGPRSFLTRQPVEGRSKNGGLRVGEMERDCLVAYGASKVLKERLMISSDIYKLELCPKCKTINLCNCGKVPVCINVPYAFKLLIMELMAMNIAVKIELDNK